MTEFVGLDLEMAFEEHYHEVLDLFDKLFVYIFDGLKTRFANEIATVKRQYPFEDFLYLPETLRLNYSDAVKLLRENGVDIGDYDDFKYVSKAATVFIHTDFYLFTAPSKKSSLEDWSAKNTKPTSTSLTNSPWLLDPSTLCPTPASLLVFVPFDPSQEKKLTQFTFS
jgi:aspartyl-tRNA synthetase